MSVESGSLVDIYTDCKINRKEYSTIEPLVPDTVDSPTVSFNPDVTIELPA